MPEWNKAASDTFTATDTDLGDLQMICSTTSNLAHSEGRVQNRTDNNALEVSNGSAYRRIVQYSGTPQTWTPTVTQSGTVTCTVNRAEYEERGIFYDCLFDLTVTGSGSAGSVVTVSLPITTGLSAGNRVGNGEIYNSTGPSRVTCNIYVASSTTIAFTQDGAYNNGWGATPSAALGSTYTLWGWFKVRL